MEVLNNKKINDELIKEKMNLQTILILKLIS